ncbi:hypothetical protein [Lysobacter gummosus]|uniref:hypothetical protein n=1 Tax=Lysobacter gummosus TaxID=262324 RepID=UPI00363177FD
MISQAPDRCPRAYKMCSTSRSRYAWPERVGGAEIATGPGSVWKPALAPARACLPRCAAGIGPCPRSAQAARAEAARPPQRPPPPARPRRPRHASHPRAI